MAKIHPQTLSVSSSSSNDDYYMKSMRETFTVWLKSLIFHGNGCTVFNSKGEIVFRVDNYQERSSNEVFLMDLYGDVLFSIQRQKVRVFGGWNGYKWSGSKANKETPWIQVRKSCKVLGGNTTCRVTMGSSAGGILYRLIGSHGNSEFKIIDSEGRVVAEAKQKRSSKGVCYGDDVLSLVVEPHTDQLLILALMTIHGLINHKL
ncbi:hypothetical protein M9H77_32701 [Catharanthus roseus]|uniref:Uncharacterized protein n=1 Tax=Catharanthus roseus TaxID=4058 RepID=A0ACC0A5P4_CATRO|nr:hypothetical protein M9H77_32701 [Catharanthus roseus]